MTITNRDGTIGPLANYCPKLSKIAQNCQIVIRKFSGAVSFHLFDKIGPVSKTCPKIPQNSSKFPKIVKTCQNSSKMSIFWSYTVNLQCNKLSFIWLWQLEARHFDWYILMSFWLWNFKDGWSLRVYKARNVLPRKNIKK